MDKDRMSPSDHLIFRGWYKSFQVFLDLHMVQVMPLSLASVKSRLVLPF